MAQRLAVTAIGAGLMGHGLAQVFAQAGHTVTATDPDKEVLAAVADADLVIEVAPERLALACGTVDASCRAPADADINAC